MDSLDFTRKRGRIEAIDSASPANLDLSVFTNEEFNVVSRELKGG
jgi:hypothetical protein